MAFPIARMTVALSAASLIAAAAPALVHAQSASQGPASIVVAMDMTVLQIQRELNRSGYTAGPVDGLMGRQTASAIEKYQRDNGLLVTGQPSRSLLEHIYASDKTRAATRDRNQSTSGASFEEDDGARRFRRLQRRLSRLDYDVDVTGEIDDQTREAIRDYQRDNNLLITGRYSDALAEHVRDAAREARQRDYRSGGRDDRQNDTASVNAATVSSIQTQLDSRGYRISNVDGNLDDDTQAAIRAYQRDEGMQVDGQPSKDLADRLNRTATFSAASSSTVREVQKELNRRGYSAGPPDGAMGPSTRSAVAEFRRDQGMTGIGRISPQVLDALKLDNVQADNSSSWGSGNNQSDDDNDSNWVARYSDDFADGNYTANPSWYIVSGSFSVNGGALASNVKSERSAEDTGRAVLQSVLGQALGVDTPSQSATAAIALPGGFSNEFRMKARVKGSPRGSARVNLGVYQGRDAGHGYRLVFDETLQGRLTLYLVNSNGSRVLATADRGTNVDDGAWHDLVMVRNAEGRMIVRFDEQKVIEITDRSMSGDFSGLSFINFGGNWSLDSIEVAAKD